MKNFAAKCKKISFFFEVFSLTHITHKSDQIIFFALLLLFVTAWCNQSMCTMQPIWIIKYAVYLFNGFFYIFLAQCYLFRVRHHSRAQIYLAYIHACNTASSFFFWRRKKIILHLYGWWWREWIKKEFFSYIYSYMHDEEKKRNTKTHFVHCQGRRSVECRVHIIIIVVVVVTKLYVFVHIAQQSTAESEWMSEWERWAAAVWIK